MLIYEMLKSGIWIFVLVELISILPCVSPLIHPHGFWHVDIYSYHDFYIVGP